MCFHMVPLLLASSSGNVVSLVEVRGSGDGPMKGGGLSAPLAWEVWEVLVSALKCLPIFIFSEFPQKGVTCGCWEWLSCWDIGTDSSCCGRRVEGAFPCHSRAPRAVFQKMTETKSECGSLLGNTDLWLNSWPILKCSHLSSALQCGIKFVCPFELLVALLISPICVQLAWNNWFSPQIFFPVFLHWFLHVSALFNTSYHACISFLLILLKYMLADGFRGNILGNF